MKRKIRPYKPRVRCPICSKMLRKNRSVYQYDYSCNDHPVKWFRPNAWDDTSHFTLGHFYALNSDARTAYLRIQTYGTGSGTVRSGEPLHVSEEIDSTETIIQWLTTMTVFS